MLKTLNFFPVRYPHSFQVVNDAVCISPKLKRTLVTSYEETKIFVQDTESVIQIYSSYWNIYDLPAIDWGPMQLYYKKWGPLYLTDKDESVRDFILACRTADFMARLIKATKSSTTVTEIVEHCEAIHATVVYMTEKPGYLKDELVSLNYFPIGDGLPWVADQANSNQEVKAYPSLRIKIYPDEIEDVELAAHDRHFAEGWLKQKLLENFATELSHMTASIIPTVGKDTITFSLRFEHNLFYYLLTTLENSTVSCQYCGKLLSGKQRRFCSLDCKEAFRKNDTYRKIKAGVRGFNLPPEIQAGLYNLIKDLLHQGRMPEEVKAIVYAKAREHRKLKE